MDLGLAILTTMYVALRCLAAFQFSFLGSKVKFKTIVCRTGIQITLYLLAWPDGKLRMIESVSDKLILM